LPEGGYNEPGTGLSISIFPNVSQDFDSRFELALIKRVKAQIARRLSDHSQIQLNLMEAIEDANSVKMAEEKSKISEASEMLSPISSFFTSQDEPIVKRYPMRFPSANPQPSSLPLKISRPNPIEIRPMLQPRRSIPNDSVFNEIRESEKRVNFGFSHIDDTFASPEVPENTHFNSDERFMFIRLRSIGTSKKIAAFAVECGVTTIGKAEILIKIIGDLKDMGFSEVCVFF